MSYTDDMNRPPHIDELARENYWFDSGGFGTETPNPPLTGNIIADIVIIGGGFTGLAAAYNLITNHPNKRIALLERASCGYGATGRNGGFAETGVRGLWRICDEQGAETARRIFDITLDGLDSIRNFAEEHGVDCDFAPNGSIELAADDSQTEMLEEEKELYNKLGLEATLIDGRDLQRTIRIDRYVAALRYPYGATLNPFKLARGMKRVVEEKGVEIYERTPAIRIERGRQVTVATPAGQVRAPAMVLATNAYSPDLGFFKNRIIPMCAYVIATAPLTMKQRESIGWPSREKLSDLNTIFNYFHLSRDDRIVFGGEGIRYLYGGRICTRLHRRTMERLRKGLLAIFPQLEGIEITHRWGGAVGMSLAFVPSVGLLGDERNIFYAVGYSGEGIVLSQVAGKIINDLYSGNDSALTRLFFVNGPVPYSLPDPLRYLGVHAYKAYLQWLAARPIH